jgi:hypothetical protein
MIFDKNQEFKAIDLDFDELLQICDQYVENLIILKG